MPTSPKSALSPSAGDDRNLVPVDENYIAPSFEDRVRLFWEKNSRAVIAACAFVILVFLGKGVFDYLQAKRENAVAADYAAATAPAATEAQAKAFISAHGDHVLGGLAQLDLADRAYKAGRFADARTAYDQAAGILKANTFGQRARLGSAISALEAGAAAEGTAALKQIVADLSLGKLVRSEAAYHLASLAVAAGDTAEAIRLVEQVASIDAQGPWADRAAALRATLPASAAPVAATDAKAADSVPAVNFK